MANTYDIGDGVRIQGGPFAVSGVATDPTTVTLIVTDPSGNAATYTYALSQVTKSAVGYYYKDITVDEVGVWTYQWTGTGTVQVVEEGIFYVQKTSNIYANVDEFKAHYFPASVTDEVDDMVIETLLEAVSRWIDKEANRRFYTTSADEARYYTAQDGETLIPPEDILSITTLQTDDDGDGTYETTWLATDFQLLPRNAALDGSPYTWIETTINGTKTFPTIPYGVKLTGKFGYCTLVNEPEMIKQACLRETERQFKLKDAPFGVAGPNEMGQQTVIPTQDPGVRMMLRPFRKIPYRR